MKEITRVRYTQQKDGSLQTEEMFSLVHNEAVSVSVDKEKLEFKVKNSKGDVLVIGAAKSLTDLKKEVKRNLKDVLGVKFCAELRVKKDKGSDNVES